ncbi:hypothetical protein HHL22_20210 [Hymenobacter sp. RP-2-7]|uniref:Uncharacterized protein n=1 Tax=Hymenobacter polaris TaxID=2682546 RepID=A0A7Y0AHZ3_9BACT|nr:hypothetical protein [Hymenobacter polaris]NML67532.1 hypothetical protein [Hymenobacter polaris]
MSELSKKWKARLLSSSIPLEYEVAKILAKYRIHTSYDYSYSRLDGAANKEFSVDIHGLGFSPFSNSNKITSRLAIIGECKFRDEGKVWAFLPEVNPLDFSTFTLGGTCKVVSAFSTKAINEEPIYNFENEFNYSLKGTEINLANGEVFDKDIKHGISQLKYALPYLLKESIEFNTLNHIGDALPFFIIPVLITNAELYLFNKDISIESIKQTESIEEIASKIPWLIFGSSLGHDFADHHKMIFKRFKKLKKDINIESFESKQIKFKNRKYNTYHSPIKEIDNLQESSVYILNKYYSQFFICSIENFDEFIKNIQAVIISSLKRRG